MEDKAEIILLLGRLDAKVDTLLLGQAALEARTTDLEKFKNYFLGISAAVGATVSGLIDFIKGLMESGS